MAAGNGFGAAERYQVDRAIRAAEQACRFEFSVFVGAAEGDAAAFANRLHSALVAPSRSILVLVDRPARLLEVVTGSEVRRHLSDRAVELVVLEMQSEFAAGQYVDGLTRGIAMLAEHARPQRTLHA